MDTDAAAGGVGTGAAKKLCCRASVKNRAELLLLYRLTEEEKGGKILGKGNDGEERLCPRTERAAYAESRFTEKSRTAPEPG